MRASTVAVESNKVMKSTVTVIETFTVPCQKAADRGQHISSRAHGPPRKI